MSSGSDSVEPLKGSSLKAEIIRSDESSKSETPKGDVLKGTVKWFNDAKGFGFIQHTSGKDVFVHYSVIQGEGYKSLKDGEPVEYEVKEGPKGFHATRVNRTNPPPSDEAAQSANGVAGSEEQAAAQAASASVADSGAHA